MFDICLFDLDETLVRTEDLKALREACRNNAAPARLREIREALDGEDCRRNYSADLLNRIRAEFPSTKLGIFTRSPRSYAKTVLAWAYPDFEWDVMVAFEDVTPTKPYGNGIDKAMQTFGVDDLSRVILVGDGDVDVRSGYNCGCVVALDTSAWPPKRTNSNWDALGLVPDAIIQSPTDIADVLRNPSGFLPELERLLANAKPVGLRRFDKIGHFIPKAIDDSSTPYQIYVCGRSFANYECVQYRKQWHQLTKSIEDHKEAKIFADEWISAIRHFIEQNYHAVFKPANIVVTVVPHRPGRKARLEMMLGQLSKSISENPIRRCKVTCEAELLAYRPTVKSQHNEHLKREERFINVRDNLVVKKLELAKAGRSFLVIDDVTTTGASLIYAHKYLTAAGATDVKCLSMAKNVGKIL